MAREQDDIIPLLPGICFQIISMVRLSPQQTLQQTLIILRHHKTKPNKFLIQKRKRRTVPDHKPFTNCPVKEILRSHIFPKNFHQKKIGAGRIRFKIGRIFHLPVDFRSFLRDQLFCLFHIGFIRKHQFSGNYCQ